ncbi:MAG: 50S ribosomal protein L4 [Candidatus Wenzhouxiangella sp. M2_3B_020]
MDTPVYTLDGTEAGRSATLEETVFGIEPNDHAIWLDVRRIQAHARQGTHKTKERNEKAGSTRKLYRQKGTGMARAGDAKSPIRKTGGRAHGARPRKYRLNLNRKTKRLARASALTYKAQEEAVRVVEDFTFEAPSTAKLRDLVGAFDASEKKVLVLTSENSPNVFRSSRNMPKVKVHEARNASTFDLLDADLIVIQEGGLQQLNETLGTAVAA